MALNFVFVHRTELLLRDARLISITAQEENMLIQAHWNKQLKRNVVVALALPFMVYAACNEDHNTAGDDVAADTLDAQAQNDATDDSLSQDELTAPAFEGTDASTQNPTAEQIVANAAKRDNVDKWYADPDCVTAEAVGNKITYTLNNCTGHWKRVYRSGVVVVTITGVTFNDTAKKIDYTVHAENIKITRKAGEGTLNFDSTASLTLDGSKRTHSGTSMASGTTARGQAYTRSGTHTVVWEGDEKCASVDGSWMTVARRTFMTTIKGLSKCADKCPKKDGSIDFTVTSAARTDHFVLSYDGSDVAQWENTYTVGSVSKTRNGTVQLECIAN